MDEGDDFKVQYVHQTNESHWYASTAEAYRAFTELGSTWVRVGRVASRDDVVAHGTQLLELAPLLYRDLHASLNKTVSTTASPGHRCYPHRADGVGTYQGCNFRAYSEMFYSGALTAEQTDAIYTAGLGLTNCEIGRFLTVGSPSGGGDGSALIFTHIPQGLPFGLLTHDMVDRFLLYFYTQSAHCATRGTWTTPESTHIDRDVGGWPYASPGQANVPMALKWLLAFEEPETRTLWLAKATPREWLTAGEAPIVATNLTSRYGRLTFSLRASDDGHGYTVSASLRLPASFASAPPAGGIRLRLRAPLEHAGRLSAVTVGGVAWSAFDAAEETVDVAAAKLTPTLLRDGLPHIVATFGGTKVPLRTARYNPAHRVVPVLPAAVREPSASPSPPEPAASSAAASAASGAPAASRAPGCPEGVEQVDSFQLNGTAWVACEDLQQPGGALVLASAAGEIEWFTKTYSPYGTNASDTEYYLGLNRTRIANAASDLLGATLLEEKAITWAAVERAVPPIRVSGPGGEWGTDCKGVRTFVGSRSSSYDGTVDDWGHVIPGHDWDGCSWIRQIDTIAINAYNDAVQEPRQTYNVSATADGMVGDVLPTAIFYLPMNPNGTSQFRYWTVTIVPVADMQGSREQNIWYRYQQLACSGPQMMAPCTLHTAPMYWDTYWFARFPGANASDTLTQTLRTGPVSPSPSSGFYRTLLENRRWWERELAAEGAHVLRLPELASTNGTMLVMQATHAMVKSMISRQNVWQPRYGVSPGFGSVVWNGLPEVFLATASAALEWGAMAYAKGVIDNHFRDYLRDDGMVWHRAEELPASGRMLTTLALYHAYAADDGTFVLSHYTRAKALADRLLARHAASLGYGPGDARYGIPEGGDDARDFSSPLDEWMAVETRPRHWYASAAELYRACLEMGRVWSSVGEAAERPDVAAHGAQLLSLAPQLWEQLHASLNRTVRVASSGARCWSATADPGPPPPPSSPPPSSPPPSFRAYAEMLHSGALPASIARDVYDGAAGGECGPRTLILGSPALEGRLLAPTTAFGLGYGLLQHDEIDRYLLHYFSLSAHSYSRGTWTTPESTDVADRDQPTAPFAAAAEVTAPVYLKWLLAFEEPETRTLWLAKATPREWLTAGEAPIVATNLTSRYGRLTFSLRASDDGHGYTVSASLRLPASFASAPPAGGIRLRLRAPLEHAGRLSAVTVGGVAWSAFDAAEETVDVAAAKLTPTLLRDGLPHIVATFGG